MRKDVYKLVAAVYEAHQKKPIDESPESIRLLEKTYEGYTRMGLALPDKEQDELKKIQEEIAQIELEFSKTLGEENGGIWFTRDELKGIPEDQMAQYKVGEDGENAGKLFVSFKYPDYLPAMRFAENGETRKKLFLGNENKCNSNVELFKKNLILKEKKARMLGYKNHAEFQIKTKMAKTPEKVMAFLDDLREKLSPGAKKEIEALKQFKKKHLEGLGQTFNGKYYIWDHP